MPTVLMLSASNIVMTFAWYWHLNHKDLPLWQVVLISWGLALFEYSLAVPANRIGYGEFTAPQLKIIQEVIALIVFAGFAVLYLGVPIRWNYAAACACVLGAVFFVMAF
jgi:uncharacterized protein (DUF486 family)